MNLVAAKCPSCGANIEVNKKNEITKCEFCKTKIIVDDAITKYKLDIEINNIPKLENYLKLGKRNYEDCKYEEAYNVYNKALELNPDNIEAILYQGLSKSLCTNIRDFEIDVALKATKNALKLLDSSNKELNDKYVLEFVVVILRLQEFIIDFYNNNKLTLRYLEDFVNKLNKCLKSLEFCLQKVYFEKNKTLILNKIIKLISYILKKKIYVNDYYEREIYIHDFKYRMELISKRKKYKKALYTLNPDIKIKDENNMKRKINLIFIILIELFIISNVLKALNENTHILWAIVLFMDFIFIIPFISKIIFKNKKRGLIIKCILLLVGILGIHISSYPEFSKYTYNSLESDLVIRFRKDKVEVNGKEKVYKYSKDGINYIIEIDNYKFKYRKIKDEYLFCELKNNECKYYFSSNNKKHQYLKKDI